MSIPKLPELREIVYKSEADYGSIPLVSKKLIHPHVSIRFTRIFLMLGLSTDQATFLMMLAAFMGAALFFVGGSVGYVGGSCLMLLSWVLDHTDGEVRRYYGESTSYNIYMDRFTHRVSYPLMHIGTGYSLWRTNTEPAFLLFGCIVAYTYQLVVEHALDKTLLQKERGDVDLAALRTVRLRITRAFPPLEWPLKIMVGGFAHVIQNNAFCIIVIVASAVGRVEDVYVGYGLLLISNWLLNVLLDFTVAFHVSEQGAETCNDGPTGEIQMH